MKKITLALAALLLAGPASADTDPAAQTVQTFYDVLTDTMKHGKELGLEGPLREAEARGRARLRPRGHDQAGGRKHLAEHRGRRPEGARRRLRAHDHRQLCEQFRQLTAARNSSSIPTSRCAARDKVVQSKLEAGKQTIPFNYRLRETGGAWKILDVYLNGSISELATRRSDFGATLSSGGAPALIKKIDALSDQLMK